MEELANNHFVLNYGIDHLGRRFIKVRRHNMHLSGYEVDRKDEEGLLLESKEMIEIAKRYGFDISAKEYQVVFFKKPPRPHSND